MADPLRIGVIGAGANTRLRHIPGLQAIDGVEVDRRLQPLGGRAAGASRTSSARSCGDGPGGDLRRRRHRRGVHRHVALPPP
jgi:predicted dehydrogenase